MKPAKTQTRTLPKCYVTPFEQGEKWRTQDKLAVQLFWDRAGNDKPYVLTECFSTN